MPPTLQGQAGIVTGAGSGIGRAVARALLDAGMKLALLGRRREALEETAAGARAETERVILPVDVADRAAVSEAIRQVEERWPKVDLLVNNAGLNTPRRALEDIAPEDWDHVVAVNLTGAFNVTRAALPLLRREGGARVINIGSTSAFRPSRVAGIAYTSSKHALAGFTATIGLEEQKNGIRATAIHPGEVDTPILEKRPTPVSAERRARILRPEDVADVVLFVATRPPQVAVPLIVVEPASQDF